MENGLIFAIGESILLEVESVKNVTYKEGEKEPSSLFIELESNKHYELALTIKNL
jgi:hypothetical protein